MTRLPGAAGRRETATDPIVLAIDTAGSACSAALTGGGAVLAADRLEMRHGHGEALLPMIDRVTTRAGLQPTQFHTIAVTIGPGGFTGIRAGLAAAHGIALATSANLIGISSFAAVVSLLGETAGAPRLVALDSRREDLYVQLFAAADGPLAEPAAVLPAGLGDYLAGAGLPPNAPLLICGDAAAAASAALVGREGVTLARDSAPDARGVAAAALRVLRDGGAIAPARPLYLRPPDVTQPRRQPASAAVR
jgi:tRNA threonylcarbamoyladenosine biosynthesis protein TsaB